jgi:hypothetical protein
MTRRWLALATGAMLYLHASPAPAEPILAAHKYQGPIPQNAISLRVGTFGGASNQEMIDFLDGRVKPPFESNPQDFSNALSIDVGFVHKPHPQFGVRLNGSAAFLSYTSTGDFVPQVEADSTLPQLKFSRELKVELFTLEASGLYYFGDSSVKELQTYLGGGFSLGFPHQSFTETRTDADTGLPFTEAIAGRPSDVSEWDVAPGVHLVGGILYYFSDRWAVSAEGRGQFMQSRFDQLQALDPETGEFENVSFVIDYTGFYLAIGATYGF